jgi:hypothetical protein
MKGKRTPTRRLPGHSRNTPTQQPAPGTRGLGLLTVPFFQRGFVRRQCRAGCLCRALVALRLQRSAPARVINAGGTACLIARCVALPLSLACHQPQAQPQVQRKAGHGAIEGCLRLLAPAPAAPSRSLTRQPSPAAANAARAVPPIAPALWLVYERRARGFNR